MEWPAKRPWSDISIKKICWRKYKFQRDWEKLNKKNKLSSAGLKFFCKTKKLFKNQNKLNNLTRAKKEPNKIKIKEKNR